MSQIRCPARIIGHICVPLLLLLLVVFSLDGVPGPKLPRIFFFSFRVLGRGDLPRVQPFHAEGEGNGGGYERDGQYHCPFGREVPDVDEDGELGGGEAEGADTVGAGFGDYCAGESGELFGLGDEGYDGCDCYCLAHGDGYGSDVTGVC